MNPSTPTDNLLDQMIVGQTRPVRTPHERKVRWTMEELLTTDFPPPIWIVEGILPAGLCLLAARPKIGKSWLALQVAMAVGSGGKVFGRDVEKGGALYLGLEDGPQRLADRVRMQGGHSGMEVEVLTEFPLLNRPEGIDILRREIESQRWRLVVLDTLARSLGASDVMDGSAMNVIVGQLQRMAVDNGVCLLVVHHHRKSSGGNGGDVIDDALGSTAIAAVADCALGIYRSRGEKSATLKVTGRDVSEAELSIVFDLTTHSWQFQGKLDDVRADSVQSDILVALGELGGSATATKIAGWLGRRPEHIFRELQELVARRKIKRGEKQGREVPYALLDGDGGSDDDE